ncbi:MAG: Tetraacyldisaccharide 4'-kinase [Phycisphaerae bacterium]|nr:Tetraacyldisaccharide 4'-kinase [Phycisphaerae bacterium]
MTLQGFHRRVIGEGAPAWAGPVRAVLAAMSHVYGAAVRARNARFDAGIGVAHVSAPVICIGNLTVGGTGKTPVVVDIVRRLSADGLRPAVLLRGYGADGGDESDEQRLIRRACRGVACVADKDRVRGARTAIEHHAADVLVLDDGFQHRRLGRDLDLVLIDATCPFGFERLIPRGLLREPVESLRRAHALIVTRTDEISPGVLIALRERLAGLCREMPVVETRHRAVGVVHLDGASVADDVRGRRVFAFAGVGNPESFRTTLIRLGAEIAGVRWLRDHARYSPGVIRAILGAASAAGTELLATTEKDAVKLEAFAGEFKDRLRVVRIDIEYVGDGSAVVERLIRRTLRGGMRWKPETRSSNAGDKDFGRHQGCRTGRRSPGEAADLRVDP